MRAIILAVALAVSAGACTQATTQAQVCERDWSSNSDTAMPHEVRGDPVASSMYSERYIRVCEQN